MFSAAPTPVVTPQPSEGELLVGEVGLDRDHRRLVDDHGLAERAAAAERDRRLGRRRARTAGVVRTTGPSRSGSTSRSAPPAAAAGGRHRGEHPVARRGPGGPPTRRPRPCRSPRGRGRSGTAGRTALDDVEVGVADAARGEAHEHVPRPDVGHRHVLDHEGRIGLVRDGNPHATLLLRLVTARSPYNCTPLFLLVSERSLPLSAAASPTGSTTPSPIRRLRGRAWRGGDRCPAGTPAPRR